MEEGMTTPQPRRGNAFLRHEKQGRSQGEKNGKTVQHFFRKFQNMGPLSSERSAIEKFPLAAQGLKILLAVSAASEESVPDGFCRARLCRS
jgi:hypothetical protein